MKISVFLGVQQPEISVTALVRLGMAVATQRRSIPSTAALLCCTSSVNISSTAGSFWLSHARLCTAFSAARSFACTSGHFCETLHASTHSTAGNSKSCRDTAKQPISRNMRLSLSFTIFLLSLQNSRLAMSDCARNISSIPMALTESGRYPELCPSRLRPWTDQRIFITKGRSQGSICDPRPPTSKHGQRRLCPVLD